MSLPRRALTLSMMRSPLIRCVSPPAWLARSVSRQMKARQQTSVLRMLSTVAAAVVVARRGDPGHCVAQGS